MSETLETTPPYTEAENTEKPEKFVVTTTTVEIPERTPEQMHSAWTQSMLLDHIQTKKPVTKAMANAIVQEVWDFIGIGLFSHPHCVNIPRLGEFRLAGKQIVFTPSNHLQLLTGVKKMVDARQAEPDNPRGLTDRPLDFDFVGKVGECNVD